MQFLPLGYRTFLDTPTDFERVTQRRDAIERTHRRTIRNERRRRE